MIAHSHGNAVYPKPRVAIVLTAQITKYLRTFCVIDITGIVYPFQQPHPRFCRDRLCRTAASFLFPESSVSASDRPLPSGVPSTPENGSCVATVPMLPQPTARLTTQMQNTAAHIQVNHDSFLRFSLLSIGYLPICAPYFIVLLSFITVFRFLYFLTLIITGKKNPGQINFLLHFFTVSCNILQIYVLALLSHSLVEKLHSPDQETICSASH